MVQERVCSSDVSGASQGAGGGDWVAAIGVDFGSSISGRDVQIVWLEVHIATGNFPATANVRVLLRLLLQWN